MRILNFLICQFIVGSFFAQDPVTHTIQSGGLTREYMLYVPNAYTGQVAVPLLFNLHGYGSTNFEQLFYGEFRPIADTANFIIVLPNGTINSQGKRSWNPFIDTSSVDDLGFIRDLLDSIKAIYNIDPNRVYSTGMSNGGFMSYLLACELNDRIAAIASVTGSMIQSKFKTCHPSRPVPIMEIHGTADNVVPYTGDSILTFVSIPTLLSAWVEFNNSNPIPVVSQVPNTNTSDGCTAERQLFTGNTQRSVVEHYKIIGGGHTWPGTIFNFLGVTNEDINASKEIWRFLSQYRLDLTSAISGYVKDQAEWNVYPNPARNYLILESAIRKPVRWIQVYDSFGRLYKTWQGNATGKFNLETISWPPGIYVLLIEQEKSYSRVKVIKGF